MAEDGGDVQGEGVRLPSSETKFAIDRVRPEKNSIEITVARRDSKIPRDKK